MKATEFALILRQQQRQHPGNDMSPAITVPSNGADSDDVSVLSFDASYTGSVHSSVGQTRFDPMIVSRKMKNDSVPRQPARRRQLPMPSSEQQDELHNNCSAHSQYSSSSSFTISDKLDRFLGMVNQLGLQISEMKAQETMNNRSSPLDVQEQIEMLRLQLEQERQLRENIQEELTIERDISVTARAELALKEVMTGMKQNIEVIQAQKAQRYKAARESMLDELMTSDKRLKKKSSSSTSNSDGKKRKNNKKSKSKSSSSYCYTIPELESVSSEFDSLSSSRKSDDCSSHSSLSSSSRGKKSSSRRKPSERRDERRFLF